MRNSAVEMIAERAPTNFSMVPVSKAVGAWGAIPPSVAVADGEDDHVSDDSLPFRSLDAVEFGRYGEE